ncbi:MAG: hypothetical protein ACLTXH_10170 [Enterobacter hormaechei]
MSDVVTVRASAAALHAEYAAAQHYRRRRYSGWRGSRQGAKGEHMWRIAAGDRRHYRVDPVANTSASQPSVRAG